ncbi:unnamed protein product [Camellia sinensis]
MKEFKLLRPYLAIMATFHSVLKLEGNPKEDPLLLWYSGGPGCSTLNGLIYEIGNEAVDKPRLNLKETKTSCNGNYYEVDPNQAECFENLRKVSKLIHDINKNCILEPKGTWASPEQNGESDRRFCRRGTGKFHFLTSKNSRNVNFNYALAYVWANDDSVQQALYVRKGRVKDWKRCDKNLDYTMNVPSVLDLHHNLTSYGLQVLVYKEQDTRLKNTSGGNVMRCSRDGYITILSSLTIC